MNTKGVGIVNLIGLTQVAVGIEQLQGAFSGAVATFAPTKSVRPSAPRIVSVQPIDNAPGTIRISLELPTTNVDGSILQQAELTRIRIYYDDESGVNENDLYNEFPVSTTLQFAPGLSGTVYVRAKVQDSHGSWSDLSNEGYATVPEVKPFEFWAHRLGVDSIFTNNSPSAGYVSWSNVKIFFKNQGYTVQNGSTNKRYIYWQKSNPTVFQTSDTVPSLGIEDVLIGTNIDGIWYLAVYHPQVSAEFLRAGKLQSRNWSASAGAEFDLDAGTFKLGGSSSPKLAWDGTNLSIVGNITVLGGSVPYSYVTGGPPSNADNTSTAIGAGIITTGRILLGSGSQVKAGIDGSGTSDTDIRIWAGATYDNRANAPFRVTQGGAVTMTSATITGTFTGTVNASGGYLGSSSAVTITSTGIDVGSSGAIRGGKTAYGSGTGFFLGYSGGTYKFDVGSSSSYIRWDGSTLNVVGNITVTGGSVPYSYVTGGPPANADNTATVIGAGLITTGRILLGQGTTVKAGIDGAGTSDSDIRIWAGTAYENRANAPFRVTQGGAVTMTSATITGTFTGTVNASGGYLGSSSAVTITSTGIDVGSSGAIRGGKTDYGSGTGFFLGYSGGTYKFDVGSSSSYIRWDGSTLNVVGNITVTGGSVPYSYVTGGPPANADNTATVIGAGLITTGRILLGQGTTVKAGIDGAGTADTEIRIWAGATYENRANAPFRVTQGGAVTMTAATITGTVNAQSGYLGSSSAVTITSTGIDVGSSGAIRGGKTGYGSGTGFFLGYSGNAYKFDVGSDASYVRWDGTTLRVAGQITILGGSGIANFSDAGALATADNLDEVPDGTTYKRTTVSEKTGAARAYSALDSSGRLVTAVLPQTPVSSPSSAGLYLGSDYMGYFNGSQWKTYMDNSGRFYCAGTNGYIHWDPGADSLAIKGTIIVNGGEVPYSYVTGGPPANADNTATVIGAGLITTGRILLGRGTTIKAGIDGAGTSDSDIRIWAGATYENRANAPFRVTQGGAVTMTSATITGGYLGSASSISIDSQGINLGTSGSIRAGKTGYGSGTGFFLGCESGIYKLDIGSNSNYVRWDGSTLSVSGVINVTGGSIPYSYITGGPPADADNTSTVIGAGLITTGRILLGSGSSVKAGIDGAGTSDSDIRIWAGASYESRSTAPFRVTQGGAVTMTSATITGTFTGTTNATGGYLGTSTVVIDSQGVNVGSSGRICGGKSSFGSGTGFYIGRYSASYVLDVGSPTQYLRFDGYSTYYTSGSSPGVDINNYYDHAITWFKSGGTLAAYIDSTGIQLGPGSSSLQFRTSLPKIYDLTGTELDIYATSGFRLRTGSGRAGYIETSSNLYISGYPKTVFQYPFDFYDWNYTGYRYTGGFNILAPAFGIYIYVGGTRYAIPVYGPV